MQKLDQNLTVTDKFGSNPVTWKAHICERSGFTGIYWAYLQCGEWGRRYRIKPVKADSIYDVLAAVIRKIKKLSK